ncbi:mechanosensitive ion channel family protein [Oscillochloris sp. ZM17-4]|uniref:mechanosensitive ion channel family protein n=1 Tax=Oscillochloris sp. ZM17-4 TaxID=2866714 RepID=UPI001C731A36|nr:mechanosensitive ion channel family protein [Oscillochloris sp. ZM17-4]MBX0330583.1 mechanosensitive ion channel family protein [Oscillochloris sp. ZM17-4]
MVEEFDAAQQANLLGSIGLLLGLIVLGLVLELWPLRWARRRSISSNNLPGEVIFTALSGQILFWSIVIGLSSTTGDLLPKLSDQMRAAILYAEALAVVILVVRLATNWVRFSFERAQIGSVSLINNVLRFMGGMVITTTILGLYGVPVGSLLTVVAGSSVGLSLALRDPLANLFSGMTVIASNKIRPGDYVRLSSGEEGYITDIRWADTYIRQLSNNLIVVPNSLMTSTIVINYSRPESEQSVLIPMGVSYASDLELVERVVAEVGVEVMEEVDGGVAEFAPFIRYTTFNASSIDFNVILRANSFVDQYLLKHEFIKRVRARFHQEGISIPFPIRTLNLNGPIPVQIQGTGVGGQGTGDGGKESGVDGQESGERG